MTAGTSTARPSLVTRPFVALSAATLAFFIQGGMILPASAPYAREALGADGLGAGLAISAFSIASLVLRPFVGWASDRFGRRPLLIGGAVAAMGALLLHLVATTLPLFIGARALLGAAEGFFFVATLSAASDIAPEERRGEAISFISLSLYLGVAIGPPIAELILDGASFAGVWLAAAGMCALAAVLAWFVPESAPQVLERRGGGHHGPRRRGPLLHPAGIFPGIVIFFGLWGMAGFLAYLPLYVPTIGVDGAGPALALYALIVVVLRVIGATWPDRFGAARLSGAALALSAVGLAIVAMAGSPLGLYLGTAIFATGVAFTMPALLALAVSQVPPEERGTVVGTATLFLDVAFGIAPAILGLIADATGYGPTFLVSAGFAALASALLVFRGRSLAGPPATG